jgi:predicted permease
MWDREFARDPSAVGHLLRLNGADFTIVGVTAEGFTGPQAFVTPDIYVPMHSFSQAMPGSQSDFLTSRTSRGVTLLGKLKRGIRTREAQAELATVAAQIAVAYPESNRDRTVSVLGYVRARFENDPLDASLALTLLAITGLVLMIACANVANLLLARGTARAKEIAIRMAVGAGRAKLVRQLLTESLLLALLGGVAGLAIGYGGIRYLASIPLPSDFPISLGVQLDGRLLLFSLVISVLTGIIFGVVPALRATHADLGSTIKAGDAGPARVLLMRGIFSGRNVLVIAQLALSVVLMIISGACIHGFEAARRIDPGFRIDHTLFFSLNPNIQRYDEGRTRDFFKKLTDVLRNTSGIRDVSMSSTISFTTSQQARRFMLAGDRPRNGEDAPTAWSYKIDEHYFPLMQINVVRGRAFSEHDSTNSPAVVIINETLAKKLFPDSDPIGQRIRLDRPDGPEKQVVGVAQNARYSYWAEPPQFALWTPFSQDFNSTMYIELRTAGDPASFASTVRDQVRALDPDMPVLRISTMQSFFDDRVMLGPRLIAQIVSTTGMMGLAMAVIGLYGVVAYAVSRRRREIGIRMAIGATPRGILGMVLRQGVVFTTIGLAIGLLIVIPLGRYALPGIVGSTSALTADVLLAVPAILATTMLSACWIPARRAARVDPTQALRQE